MMLCVFSDVCLQPGTTGGIESDSTILPMPSHESLDVMDGKCNGKKSPETVSHSVAHNGACPFNCTFYQLLINNVQRI